MAADSVLPFSMTGSSKPPGSCMNISYAPTSRSACSTFSREIEGSSRLTFEAIVPVNRNGSCSTMPICWRSCCFVNSRTSTAVYLDLAPLHVVETEQQVQNRAFARTRMADQRDRLALARAERDVLEHILARLVAERHVVEAHVALVTLPSGCPTLRCPVHRARSNTRSADTRATSKFDSWLTIPTIGCIIRFM